MGCFNVPPVCEGRKVFTGFDFVGMYGIMLLDYSLKNFKAFNARL